jgi:hypothetical protein
MKETNPMKTLQVILTTTGTTTHKLRLNETFTKMISALTIQVWSEREDIPSCYRKAKMAQL